MTCSLKGTNPKYNLIDIMQGRLLPKYQKRYQVHPVRYWQKEFSIAKEIGLNYIEFIFDIVWNTILLIAMLVLPKYSKSLVIPVFR
jgi:hypothetical protein